MSTKKWEVSRRNFLGVSFGVGVGLGVVGCVEDGMSNEAGNLGSTSGPIIYPNQDESEIRWAFLIDLRRCAGCSACSVACKTASDVRLGVFKNGVKHLESGTYPTVTRNFVPWLCNHCKNPPCLEYCPTDPITGALTFPSGEVAYFEAKATYQRPDGLVLVDQERCVGCGACVAACPYKVRYLDPVKAAGGGSPSSKAADKCNLCTQRLENGVVPACVNTCPASARMVGNINDPSSDIRLAIAAAESAGATVSGIPDPSGNGADPQVYYVDFDQDTYDNGDEPRKEVGIQVSV
jgi:tetrathionate reductase subunit B